MEKLTVDKMLTKRKVGDLLEIEGRLYRIDAVPYGSGVVKDDEVVDEEVSLRLKWVKPEYDEATNGPEAVAFEVSA